MSQNTARQHTTAQSEDEEIGYPPSGHPDRKQDHRPHRPLAQPPDDTESPDEPDEGEHQLIGDNDLSASDLGPAAPHHTNPDVGPDPLPKITR